MGNKIAVSEKLRQEIDNILDCFSGANSDFIFFRCFVEEMYRRSQGGEAAAGELLEIVSRFSRLIDVSRRSFEDGVKNLT